MRLWSVGRRKVGYFENIFMKGGVQDGNSKQPKGRKKVLNMGGEDMVWSVMSRQERKKEVVIKETFSYFEILPGPLGGTLPPQKVTSLTELDLLHQILQRLSLTYTRADRIEANVFNN